MNFKVYWKKMLQYFEDENWPLYDVYSDEGTAVSFVRGDNLTLRTFIWLDKDTLTNRTKIYSRDGQFVGYVKENTWLNRHDIFDRKEQRKAYIKKNTFVKDRYDVFDQNQRRKGYIKKNDFLQGTYEYFPLDER